MKTIIVDNNTREINLNGKTKLIYGDGHIQIWTPHKKKLSNVEPHQLYRLLKKVEAQSVARIAAMEGGYDFEFQTTIVKVLLDCGEKSKDYFVKIYQFDDQNLIETTYKFDRAQEKSMDKGTKFFNKIKTRLNFK